VKVGLAIDEVDEETAEEASDGASLISSAATAAIKAAATRKLRMVGKKTAYPHGRTKRKRSGIKEGNGRWV
jgi:hypothetical protein